MSGIFMRRLERRGLYVGTFGDWPASDALGPVPTVYFALRLGPQPERSQMVRLEAGFRGRGFWVDWGRDH